MSSLKDLLNDDTNQFGPGTDLAISLLGVMLVIAMIATHRFGEEKTKGAALKKDVAFLSAALGRCEERLQRCEESIVPKTEGAGNFKPASEYFTAADFYPYPVTRLVNERATQARIARIAQEYRRLEPEYPFLFVIGHSSALDDPRANDHSENARHKRNLEYALRRSALIAGLMQEHLNPVEQEHLVAVTTGEADLRDPAQPLSQANAWVEVMFAKEWKPPERRQAQ